MVATTPTVCKLVLGRLLNDWRDQKGIKPEAAAHALHRKDAKKIGLVESGQASLTPAELNLLIELYGVTDEDLIADAFQLRQNSSQRGRWTGFRKVFGSNFRQYVDMEEDADQLRIVEVEEVPVLLQTDEYIRALFSERVHSGGHSLEERVQARLSRQTILTRPDPPQVHFVMSESCIRRQRGDDAVMRRQVEHIIKLGRLPNVRIQLVPFKPGAGRPQASIGYRFSLMRLPSPGLAGPLEYSYAELPNDLRLIDDKKAVAAHDAVWATLCDAALSPSETARFLAAELR